MPAAMNETLKVKKEKKEKTEVKKASKRKAEEVPTLVEIVSDVKVKKAKVNKEETKPALKKDAAAAAITASTVSTGTAPSVSPQEYRKLHDITVQSFGGQGEPPLFQRFEDAPFPPALHAALKAAGFKEPSPIQAAAWPLALTGRDVLATAKTGSGECSSSKPKSLLRILPSLVTTPTSSFCIPSSLTLLTPSLSPFYSIRQDRGLPPPCHRKVPQVQPSPRPCCCPQAFWNQASTRS